MQIYKQTHWSSHKESLWLNIDIYMKLYKSVFKFEINYLYTYTIKYTDYLQFYRYILCPFPKYHTFFNIRRYTILSVKILIDQIVLYKYFTVNLCAITHFHKNLIILLVIHFY